MTLLLEAARLLLLALLGVTNLIGEKGLATRYGDPGDKLTGKHLSCTHQPMQPGMMVCAHRTLPCGSVVMLHNPRTKKFAVCQVLDRGPFGAIMPTGEWGVKIRPWEPGTWRGIVDLSPSVADALDFNGRERVQIVYQKVAHHLRVARSLHR
jgi:rare lipoprotein A (peptidoglycan hydrolase)